MNVAAWLEKCGAQSRRPPGNRSRRRAPSLLRRLGGTGASYRRRAARQARLPAGRPRRHRHDELSGVPRGGVCDLACRAGCRADQRQAAPQRVRLHHRAFRRAHRLRLTRPRGKPSRHWSIAWRDSSVSSSRVARNGEVSARRGHRSRRSAAGGMLPGCSTTPRAPPGAPRALSSPIAIC